MTPQAAALAESPAQRAERGHSQVALWIAGASRGADLQSLKGKTESKGCRKGHPTQMTGHSFTIERHTQSER